MQVKAAHADEKHLAFHAKKLTRRDQPGNDRQLVRQTIAPGGRAERRGQRGWASTI